MQKSIWKNKPLDLATKLFNYNDNVLSLFIILMETMPYVVFNQQHLYMFNQTTDKKWFFGNPYCILVDNMNASGKPSLYV